MTDNDLAGLTPTSFQQGNVPADVAADLAGQIHVLDLQEMLPGVRRLRDWTLAVLDPQEGETAVDVGCGTGAEVRRIAGLVGPAGRALGVEPHAGLRAEAEVRAAAEGVTAVFVDGEAGALPFADRSVDVIRCERVFQHLADPEGAAREFARVLAPGGRVAVTDSDWATLVQAVGDPDVVRRVNESAWRRTPHPFAGRSLRWWLRQAGLVVDADIGADAVIVPEAHLRDLTLLRLNLSAAIEEGAVTTGEAEQLERDTVEGAVRGEAFGAVSMFSVVGRSVEPASYSRPREHSG